MASFLQGLGAFGAGIAPSINDLANQQSNTDFGNALSAIYGGGAAPNTQQQGGLGGLLSGLGGQQQPTLPAAQISPVSGGAQPVSQGPGMGTSTPAIPGGVATQGGAAPQQPQAAPQQPPQPPPQPPQQGMAPAQSAQPQQRPQAAQNAPVGQGPLTLDNLVRNLVKQGITGHRLGNAVTRLIPLLNAQGLQQYRDIGLQLRNEQIQSLEKEREYNRDPNAPGSRAQSRTANQNIAIQRMEAVQARFKERMQAATEKLQSAKTDKEATQAKNDLDKIASDLKGELQSELNIVNSPGTSPEDQKAAAQKAGEIRQQLQDATDAAIKGRRGGAQSAASGDKSEEQPVYNASGEQVRYKGTGDRKDPANWEPVSGGQ